MCSVLPCYGGHELHDGYSGTGTVPTRRVRGWSPGCRGWRMEERMMLESRWKRAWSRSRLVNSSMPGSVHTFHLTHQQPAPSA